MDLAYWLACERSPTTANLKEALNGSARQQRRREREHGYNWPEGTVNGHTLTRDECRLRAALLDELAAKL